MNIQNVYLIGLGAIGSAYGSQLYKHDPHLLRVLVNPQRKAEYMAARIKVNNVRYDFNYCTTSDPLPPADLILVAVKFPDLQQAIADFQPIISENTAVISLLNGVISEQIIGQAIGPQHLLYAYSTAVASQSTEDRWSRQCPSLGKIFFGERTNETLSPRVKAIKTLFDTARIPCDVPQNMIRAQWTKFMINTGINQAAAVLGVAYEAFQKEGPARELALMAAAEVIAISKESGVDLDETDIDYMVSLINTHDPKSKNSMLQDIEARRKTEVDNFSGAVIQLGMKYNVPTPVNKTLYRIKKAIEEKSHPTL
jgi:2-dehydropantoate 2-reductase